MKEEEWDEWKHHEVTKQVFGYFEKVREAIINEWASGSYTRETAEGTAQLNAEALSKVSILNEIINLEADDIGE